jgi:hypothetical protein
VLTGKQLTHLADTSLPDPHPNGGRIEYATGIDVSNAQSVGHGLDIDYSIYLGHTAALTSAFWKTSRDSLVGAPTVAGPWLDARWYAPGPTLYVHATHTRTLTVRVLDLNGTAGGAAAEHRAASIARKLTAVLKRGS